MEHSATANNDQVNVKRLNDLLQEQQEPFDLEVYLSERCYAKRDLNLCSPANSLKRSRSSRSRTSIAHFSKLLQTLYNKVAFFNGHGVRGPKTMNDKDCSSSSEFVEEFGRISNFGSATTFFSSSENDKEGKPASSRKEKSSFDTICFEKFNDSEEETCLKDTRIQRSTEMDKDQLETVSVTKQEALIAPSHDLPHVDSQNSSIMQAVKVPTCKILLPIKITEDSLFSISILEMLLHSSKDKLGFSRAEELSRAVDSYTCSEYLNSKRVLLQTKQLLFDCVTEVIEAHERKERAKGHEQVVLGPEEIGKLISEKIMAWGRTSREEANINELVYMDYLYEREEWEDCVPQKIQISSELADAIVEEITDELVSEMIDLQLTGMSSACNSHC